MRALTLDGCFAATFIMLARGDLHDVIMNGKKDTAKVRRLLAGAGRSNAIVWLTCCDRKFMVQGVPMSLSNRSTVVS